MKKIIQPQTQPIRFIQQLQPAPALSKEQDMLQEFFGGWSMWHLPEDNLPRMTGESLMPNSVGNDINDETAETFGFGRIKSQTGEFFGLW